MKYISHLDVTRCLARVFKRSGLPIWYTQGFNPHAYLTFALPLPLGVESQCESFDFRLTEEIGYEDICERLNAALPNELRALHAAAPVMEPGNICWADYQLSFYDKDPAVEEALDRLLAVEHLPVRKKTKKGEQEIDLKEKMTIRNVIRTADKLVLEVRLPAGGTQNWSPMLLTGAYNELLGREPYWTGITRTAILAEDFQDFC